MIITQESLFEFQMKKLIKKFVKDFSLENLNPEELQNVIWTKYSNDFGQAVLELCVNFAGDELFELED